MPKHSFWKFAEVKVAEVRQKVPVVKSLKESAASDAFSFLCNVGDRLPTSSENDEIV